MVSLSDLLSRGYKSTSPSVQKTLEKIATVQKKVTTPTTSSRTTTSSKTSITSNTTPNSDKEQPPYSGTPLEPIGASDVNVQRVLEEVAAGKELGKTQPSAPMEDLTTELQQDTSLPKEPPADKGGNGGATDWNTIFEGLLALLTPGLYLGDQAKDILTGEKQTIVDVAAAPSMTLFGTGGSLLSIGTLETAAGQGLLPPAAAPSSIFPDLDWGGVAKWGAILVGGLAGIWLLGKYIGRGK